MSQRNSGYEMKNCRSQKSGEGQLMSPDPIDPFEDIEAGLYEIALKYVEERMDAPEGSKASEELEWASKIVEQYEEMKGFVK